jgi:hypothetical protein
MYQKSVYPANSMLDNQGGVIDIDRSHFMKTQIETINKLKNDGLIK